MDTRWKKYSCLLPAKLVAFCVTVLCFAGCLTLFVNMMVRYEQDFSLAYEESYFQGQDYLADCSEVLHSLKAITGEYKSEEHILSGGSITPKEMESLEKNLYRDFRHESRAYNPNLTDAENYQVFRDIYAAQIQKEKEELIQDELRQYRETLHRLAGYQGLVYYARSGDTELTNCPGQTRDYFTSFPAYMLFEGFEKQVFPEEVRQNKNYDRYDRYGGLEAGINQLGGKDVIYFAFTEEFLNPRLEAWQAGKQLVTRSQYQMAGLALASAVALVYLLLVTGRRPEEEDRVHLSAVDRLPADINIVLCLTIMGLWFAPIAVVHHTRIYAMIFPVTLLLAVPGLLLVLSLARQVKSGILIKNSLFYRLCRAIYNFGRDVYQSGSTAVKVVLIVIGYPLLVAATFFMFPVTIGVAAWLALKQVKEFDAVKKGVKRVKAGDIHYRIDIPGNGELARLAADINSITDGLDQAVANEIKSERLKSELISNVSHDIRTPLTSIITYVDLLKKTTDQAQAAEYIAVIDQKAQRLKVLTDDLFEAAKVTSGSIPVNLEQIDLVSLITQGLGEFDDRIRESGLTFKLNAPDKAMVRADGKLLWRALENLLLNTCKYALPGSRVYIDIVADGAAVTLTLKNISACELNISADELMERFTRGDASRSSQGSGLGLSIAKSLVEIQRGSFQIEIDGDLFKAVIHLSKAA